MYQEQIIKSFFNLPEQETIGALELISGREEFVFKSDLYLAIYESIIKYFDTFDKVPSAKYLIEHYTSDKNEIGEELEALMAKTDVEVTEDLTALVATQLKLNVKKQIAETAKSFSNKVKSGGTELLQDDLAGLIEDLVTYDSALDLKEHKRGLLAVNPNDIKTLQPAERYKKKYRKRQASDSYYIGKFGIEKLDDTLGGLNRSDMVNILGFSGQGKSTWMRQLGYNFLQQNLNVVFVTLEMSFDSIEDAFYVLHANNYKRFGFKCPRISSAKLKQTSLDKKEEQFLFDEVIPDFTSAPGMGSLYVIQPENDEYSINDLFADIRKIHKTIMPVDLLILDYATLMIPSKKVPSPDRDQTNRMLRRLRMFSLAFDKGRQLPIINACQSNRAGFDHFLKHDAHLYDLSALSDYNSLERDATIIMSVGQTPEDAAASQVRIQNLKSRESAKFLPFICTVDGASGTYLTSNSETISEDDALDMLNEIEI